MRQFLGLFVVASFFIVVLIVQAPSSFAYETRQADTQVQSINKSVRHYDVTTPAGRNQVAEQIFDWYCDWSACGMIRDSNIWKMSRWGWNNFAPGNVAVGETEVQQKAAVEIIRAGKDNNVDELEITMSEKAGLGLDAKSIEGIPVEFTIGTSGLVNLKVKYKS